MVNRTNSEETIRVACVTCVWKKIEEYTMEDNVVAWLRGEFMRKGRREEPATALH